MRRQLPTSNISTSRNDVLFHVTGVLPAIEILKTGAIKCSKPSAWERANGAKLNYVAFTRTLTSEFLKAARVRGPLVIFRLDGRTLSWAHSLKPFNYNPSVARKAGWVEAEERLSTKQPFVQISGAIIGIYVEGEGSADLTAQLTATKLPVYSLQEISHQTTAAPAQADPVLGWRFPATPTPTLPLTPADWPKLSWPSVCKALQVQSISDACETLSEIWRVRNQLLRLRARGQELPDNPNYSRVAAAMQW